MPNMDGLRSEFPSVNAEQCPLLLLSLLDKPQQQAEERFINGRWFGCQGLLTGTPV